MATPLVSLVVLNWNGADLLKECIDSLQKLDYSPAEIIVVDNASTDGSIALLESMKGISVVRNTTNLGYAGGLNAGIKACKGTYVATLNNDLTFEPSWLSAIVQVLEQDSTIGIAGGRQMNYFDRETVDALYSYLHPSLIFFQEAFRERYNAARYGAAPLRVFGVTGASTVYRRKMFEELNGLDETLFAYHEESDLCMRAFCAGWKCVFVPNAVTYHKRSVTFNRVKGAMFYYQTRNRIWFIYKYSPGWLVFRNLFFILFTELRILRVVIFRERVWGAYCKGLFHGLRGLAGFSKVRKKNMGLLKEKSEEYELLRKRRYLPL